MSAQLFGKHLHLSRRRMEPQFSEKESASLTSLRFGFRQQDISGEVVVMIQQNVGLHAPFGAPELCPREQGQAQRNGGGIQREQLIL